MDASEGWVRKFLKLEHGIPSHDTFCDVYSALEPEAITKSFAEWVETIREKVSGEVVALDGKTICASRDVPKNKRDIAFLDPESRWKNLSGIGMLTTTQQTPCA